MRQLLLAVIVIFCFQGLKASTLKLKVRLFYGQQISSLKIKATRGHYHIKSNDSKVSELSKTSMDFAFEDGKISLSLLGRKIGQYKSLSLEGTSADAVLSIQANGENRSCEGNFTVTANGKGLLVTNRIDLEKYVAGVVEAEGGDGRNLEFYKVQCLISRTYAVKNMRKHEAEGFHFCDQVHCQHYKGRGKYSEILEACRATHNEVIVDSGGNLISAAFHSNSGGQTVNSEDVWTYAESYLRSVPDTFSLGMPKASWTKSLASADWLRYLDTAFQYPVNDPLMRDSALNFRRQERGLAFAAGVPLKAIRNRFELRSTWFATEARGDSVFVSGRGYGHGIGLSQEGALNMARLGYKVGDILNYYYRNVKVVKLQAGMIPKKP